MTDDVVDIDLSEVDPDLTEEQYLADLGEPAPIPESKPTSPLVEYLRKQALMDIDDLYAQPPIEWFIQDLLPFVNRTMVVGAGGTFKSFLVLDWMLCAAARRPWFGRYVKWGRVLYMAGEGARGLPKRIDAWCAHNGVDREDLRENIHFLAQPFELKGMSDLGVAAWRALIRGGHYRYVVVDTLHTAAAGAEENSNTEMGSILARAQQLVGGENTQTALIFVHHKPKGEGRGARGADTLRSDVDVSVLLDKPKGSMIATLQPDKLRDVEEFHNLFVQFARHEGEEHMQNSLYIEAVARRKEDLLQHPDDEDDNVDIQRRETAVDRAMEAIVYHDLLDRRTDGRPWGEPRITEELKHLELGYNFSASTVGRALRNLRESQTEVQNIQRRQQDANDG